MTFSRIKNLPLELFNCFSRRIASDFKSKNSTCITIQGRNLTVWPLFALSLCELKRFIRGWDVLLIQLPKVYNEQCNLWQQIDCVNGTCRLNQMYNQCKSWNIFQNKEHIQHT